MPPQEPFVSRLPCELLDNIFLVAFAAEVSPITLSHVSSHWRNRIIHNSPSIWTRLYISLDHWNPGRIDCINCFITRSSPLPLSIIVDFGKVTEQNAIPKARLGPQILSSLLQAASRWKILDTHGLFFRNTFFPPNIELPLLEKLLITGTIGRKPVSAFGRAPNLWFLAASEFWPLEHHFKVPWSQIRDARIHFRDLLTHSAQMTRLEALHVLGMFTSIDPFQILYLPTVLHLALHTETSRILQCFRFNNLISLEIILDSWDSADHSCLTPIIDRFVAVAFIGSSLRHLSTSFFPSSGSNQFKQLLQKLPYLETLKLTCIWVQESTNFPEDCACLFQDLSETGSTYLVPNLQRLTLRGAPYLDHHFQALMISRGPSLLVSVIFKDIITNPGNELRSHEGYMYQTLLYSWLTIRSHLQELRTSGRITIHVEGENQLLERWGPDLTNRHCSFVSKWATLHQCVYYYSTDVPNYIWGENKWPPNVKIVGVDEVTGWGLTVPAAEFTYLEAARALKEKYKEIGNLDQVKLDPFLKNGAT